MFWNFFKKEYKKAKSSNSALEKNSSEELISFIKKLNVRNDGKRSGGWCEANIKLSVEKARNYHPCFLTFLVLINWIIIVCVLPIPITDKE